MISPRYDGSTLSLGKLSHYLFNFRLLSRWSLFLLLLVVILGTATGWYWLGTRSRINPPMPMEINDKEIAVAVEKARNLVIQNSTSANWGYYGMLLTAHQFDEEATQCYREAMRLDPLDSRWPFILGITSTKRNPNEGLDLIRQAIQVNSWENYQVSMVIALVELLIERNQFEEAEKYLATIPPPNQELARVNLARGLLAFQKGDEAIARDYFLPLRSNPHARRRVTAHLANLARSANDLEEAARLETALKKMPSDPDWPDPLIYEVIRLRVGKRARESTIKILEDQKKYEEAAREFIKDLAMERTLKRLIGAGLNLTRSRLYSEALGYLYEATALDPKSAQAHHYLSICLLMDAINKFTNQGDPEEVEKEFDECARQAQITIQLKPDHANGFLICGSALKMLGKYDEAIDILQKGLTIKPDNAVLHMALAEAYKSRGDGKMAKKHYLLGASADPAISNDPRLLEIIESIKNLQ